MPKQCHVVNCSNIFVKGSGVQFYRFPADPERKSGSLPLIEKTDIPRNIRGSVVNTSCLELKATTLWHQIMYHHCLNM